ncbi:MAG: hypothetical protein PWQ81_911, partial [Bacteroidota bacterium]|nr:hypothetical protein [Bacteroidota bacterium]
MPRIPRVLLPKAYKPMMRSETLSAKT